MVCNTYPAMELGPAPRCLEWPRHPITTLHYGQRSLLPRIQSLALCGKNIQIPISISNTFPNSTAAFVFALATSGVAMQQNLHATHGPSDREKRYDRQLRLWAASGQDALEAAHILLINSGPGVVGIETLKNLVLPGLYYALILSLVRVPQL